MSATIHAFGSSRFARDRTTQAPTPFPRPSRLAPPFNRSPADDSHAWLVDLAALARCRSLLLRHALNASSGAYAPGQQSLMDVPAAYDQFCRSHFTSVRRLHPGLTWGDACPAYAIALSAHALLCEALDDEREQILQDNWLHVRGSSTLSWTQARGLIADGCSALARLDPLAMHR